MSKGVVYTTLPESKVKCYSEYETIKREKEQKIVTKEDEEQKYYAMKWFSTGKY